MNNTFIKSILSDLRVELTDEFDRNFERKAFFDRPWPQVTIPNKRGSLLMRSGALRRSIRSQLQGNSIRFYSSLPYAAIQNDGGAIVVTAKMKRFFWAMYYSLISKITYNVRTKSANYNKKAQTVSQEARYWKAMAINPIGSRIIIKPRPFIGHHPQVDKAVRRVVDSNLNEIQTYLKSHLTPNSKL